MIVSYLRGTSPGVLSAIPDASVAAVVCDPPYGTGVNVAEIQRLTRFETYVCQVIAMGNQADLTVEALPK